jgi:sugar O-acyltransferase (sialic acid O-acetyltransferase NeuD family)
MKREQIILIGGGGHCNSCIDVIEAEGRFQIAGIVDMPEKTGQKISGYSVIAGDDDIPALALEYKFFHISLGQIKSPENRIKIFQQLLKAGAKLPVIASPHAYISSKAIIGQGSIIMHYAIVNAGAVIGDNCIINTRALIEHDAKIGDHCHISTSAVINGACIIQNYCFIGSNAVVAHTKKVGEAAVVGAGGVVLKDIPGNYVYAGNPVRKIS